MHFEVIRDLETDYRIASTTLVFGSQITALESKVSRYRLATENIQLRLAFSTVVLKTKHAACLIGLELRLPG